MSDGVRGMFLKKIRKAFDTGVWGVRKRIQCGGGAGTTEEMLGWVTRAGSQPMCPETTYPLIWDLIQTFYFLVLEGLRERFQKKILNPLA